MDVRVRIAPSPTGYLHLGTARSALFNYLFAKKNNGTFILRIEDTDKERSKPEFEQSIMNGLRWLGILWDEGPDCGGLYGPYRQSERADFYAKAFSTLEQKGMVYECYCTTQELEEEKRIQMLSKQPPRYNSKCRDLSDNTREQLRKEKGSWVYRFRTPAQIVEWNDLIHGVVSFDTKLFGDMVIAKQDKGVLYNFAVVVDDELMRISHVIRGEDHISNTPKQILMAQALDYHLPIYGHIPLILNPDRSKMSKRKQEVDIDAFRRHGYLPEAMLNYISFLGWNPGDDRELFTLEELCQFFSIDRVQKSGAIFSTQKLDWFNQEYIRNKSTEELLSLCQPYLPKEHSLRSDQLLAIITIVKDRLRVCSDSTVLADFFFTAPVFSDPTILIWKKMKTDDPKTRTHALLDQLRTYLETIEHDAWQTDVLEARIKQWITDNQIGAGEILWPMRVALSGKEQSPGPFEIAHVLGSVESLKRISYALQQLS